LGVGKRKMRRFVFLVSVVAVAYAAAAALASGTPRDLPVSYLFSGPGHMTTLRGGATYQASSFPFALRLTPPDGGWAAAQWKTGRLGCCGTINGVGNYGGPPFFGWAAVGHGTNPQVAPQGFLLIETAYAHTPSVAGVVTSLRTRGSGATYQAASAVKLAGFSGMQFDGAVTGSTHLFVPFGAPTHNAHYFPDGIRRRATTGLPLHHPERKREDRRHLHRQRRAPGQQVPNLPHQGRPDPQQAQIPRIAATASPEASNQGPTKPARGIVPELNVILDRGVRRAPQTRASGG
jgi:hypothetical protein